MRVDLAAVEQRLIPGSFLGINQNQAQNRFLQFLVAPAIFR
jgi:hypothetical protein